MGNMTQNGQTQTDRSSSSATASGQEEDGSGCKARPIRRLFARARRDALVHYSRWAACRSRGLRGFERLVEIFSQIVRMFEPD
jgi:hypothetical protein